jgi:hypothetical protein
VGEHEARGAGADDADLRLHALEDDRAVRVHEHPVLQVPLDGSREHDPLDVAADPLGSMIGPASSSSVT